MHEEAPELLVMRNMTRMGVFHRANEHDGTGLELLTDHLDAVHLAPYPVNAEGYQEEAIPRDMSYCAGLARRYDRPLIPWLQAHTYGGADGLQHPDPDHIRRMCRQHRRHGVDAIVWLGYGDTFPNARPESWAAAGQCHQRLKTNPPESPTAQLAVLRSYDRRALLSDHDGAVRNPADWMLQQWLHVWAVRHGQPYDVFEIPPSLSDTRRAELQRELADYDHLVATSEWPDAWVLGTGTEGQTVSPSDAESYRRKYEEALNRKGWLSSSHRAVVGGTETRSSDATVGAGVASVAENLHNSRRTPSENVPFRMRAPPAFEPGRVTFLPRRAPDPAASQRNPQ